MKRISIFLVTLFFFFSGVIFASTAIELKSGQKVEGELIEETADYIRMNVAGVELAFYKDEIKGREEKKPVPEAPIKTEVQAVDHKAAPALSVKKVYAAYQVAVQSSDIKGLRKYVFSQAIAELDDVENAAMVLNLMKKMSPENVKIIDEKVDGETATLTATAEGMFGSSRGVISFVKEEGAWKLVKENWEAGRSIETKAGESENLKPPVDMTVNDNAVGVAVDNLPVSTKQIIPKTTGMVIDGQAGDWAGVTVLIADGEGDVRESFMGEPAYEFDVTDVKMALGEKDLYILIKFAQ
ncbi:MAG: hypothetical protein KAR05_05780, partial [Candidatus Omnitrophica bacterium]|nr:hypothetical protein [Candidatus Omnitrophota bacterium]